MIWILELIKYVCPTEKNLVIMLSKVTDPKILTKYMSKQQNAFRNRNQCTYVIQISTLFKYFLNQMHNLCDDVCICIFIYEYNIKYCNSFSKFLSSELFVHIIKFSCTKWKYSRKWVHRLLIKLIYQIIFHQDISLYDKFLQSI